MAVSVKHKFTSAKADGPDSTQIRPSNWNDTHDIELAGPALLGKPDAGSGPAVEVSAGGGLAFSGSSIRVAAGGITSDMHAAGSVDTAALGADAVTAAKVSAADAPAIRSKIGLGSVATESTVPIAKGGTGQISAADAFSALAQIASKAEAEAGSNNTKMMTALRVKEAILALLSAAGSAPVFAVRAWVRANASTTPPSILASGNVSSITRLSGAVHDVNFATAMPDENYSVAGFTAGHTVMQASNYRTTAVTITSTRSWDLAAINPTDMNIIVVR